jgi:hypothetical protein
VNSLVIVSHFSFFGLPEQQESAAEKYRRALEQKAQKERELGGGRSGRPGGRGRDSGGGVIGQKRKASAAPTEEDLDKARAHVAHSSCPARKPFSVFTCFHYYACSSISLAMLATRHTDKNLTIASLPPLCSYGNGKR